jgi:hypothetical protein
MSVLLIPCRSLPTSASSTTSPPEWQFEHPNFVATNARERRSSRDVRMKSSDPKNALHIKIMQNRRYSCDGCCLSAAASRRHPCLICSGVYAAYPKMSPDERLRPT